MLSAVLCSVACHVQLFVILWTVVYKAHLPMGFSRQEYWSGNVLPCPPPGDLLDTGIEPMAPASPGLQVDFLLLSHWGSPVMSIGYVMMSSSFPVLKIESLFFFFSYLTCLEYYQFYWSLQRTIFLFFIFQGIFNLESGCCYCHPLTQ